MDILTNAQAERQARLLAYLLMTEADHAAAAAADAKREREWDWTA